MVTVAGPVAGERGMQPTPTEGIDSLALERGEPTPSAVMVDDAAGILPLQVRAVRLGDLSALRQLSAYYRLNQPDASLEPPSVLRAGLAASMPFRRTSRPAFVAVAGQRLVGFAPFRTAHPDRRWRLLALGSSVGVFDADPVWEALLTHAVRDAGLRGVKRLYARLPLGVPVGPALRRMGWTPYAAETIYAAATPDFGRRSSSVRPQTPADTWAIHQLYSAAVPRPVQVAEAHTSHRWELHPGRRGGGENARAGWLIEEGHDVVGYARAMSRARLHVLEIIFLPGRTDVISDLLSGALAALPNPPARRVLCAVRTYQAEVGTALEGRGFVPVQEQDLSVKYTTATVRSPAVEAVPFHVEVRDSLPQRVPSFLHGRPRDGSAD